MKKLSYLLVPLIVLLCSCGGVDSDMNKYYNIPTKNILKTKKAIKLVKKHSDGNWRELCMDYTWEWSSRVGGISPKNVPAEMKSDADKKADAAITRAEKFIGKGNRRYEGFLRSIPQWKIMQVLMEFKGNP